MKKLTLYGERLLAVQRKLAASRAAAEEAEVLSGKALMKAKRSRDLCDDASELLKPYLLAEIMKLDKDALDRLTPIGR